MKKIFLTGGIDFGHSNRGCQALSYGSLSFLQKQYDLTTCRVIIPRFYMKKKYKDNTITVDIGDENVKLVIRYYWIGDILISTILRRLFGQKKFLRFLKFYKDVHRIDAFYNISGGDSFSDIYGFKQYIFWAVPSVVAILNKVKVVLLPQTVGPFLKWRNRIIAHYILRNSSEVFIRDREYLKELERLKVSYKWHPDVSLFMNPIKVNYDIQKGSVGINVSGLAYYDSYGDLKGRFPYYKDLIIQIIKKFQSLSVKIYLLPHTYVFQNPIPVSDDLSAIKDVFNDLDDQAGVYVVDENYSAPELKYIISQFVFFIGTRMHSCFASIFTGVPVYGLAYSYKFSGTFDEYGLGDFYSNIVDIKQDDVCKITEHVFDSYLNRNTQTRITYQD